MEPMWRERAVERSTRAARARARSRSEAFIAAANALLLETGRTDFTVLEIVARSGLSLRAFYQHFAGKDELLLALFEEAIRSYMDLLRVEVERHDDASAQLEALVNGLLGAVETQAMPGARALTIYHLQLGETLPDRFAQALAPQTALVLSIVQRGVMQGRFRTDVEAAKLAMMIMQSLVSATQMSVLGIHMTGATVRPADLTAFLLGALARPESNGGRKRDTRRLR